MTLSVQISHALQDLDLNVAFETPPGVTVLFGASGSGKTSVVNTVAGLLRPKQGRIKIDGFELLNTNKRRSLPPHKRGLGYIFQEARLFPHLSVKQNLNYGAWFARRAGKSPEDFGRVMDMLGIGSLLTRRPVTLSGGEKQRVAIGRALLASPRMLLADEPLAALDDARKAEILPYFERLRDETNIPILYVSHSSAEVARLATTVVVLDRGRVTHQGSAAEVLGDPEVLPTGVRGAGALLIAHVSQHHEDGLTELDASGSPLFLPRIPQAIGVEVRIRVAAHEVMISRDQPKDLSALNVLKGYVSSIRAGTGPGAIVSLQTGAGTVLARITQRSVKALKLQEGVSCFAIIKSVAIAPEDIGGG